MYIALDLETTGFDPALDYPIEIAAIRFDHTGIHDTFVTLVDPGVTIPTIVTHITGIRQEDIEGQPTLNDIRGRLTDFIGSYPIVGHNIQFDTTFLRHKGFGLTNPEFDTMTLTNILYPNLPSYSLETIAGIFGLADKQDHRALSDTVISAKLFHGLLEIIQTLPDEQRKAVAELFENSAPHYAELFKTPLKIKTTDILSNRKSAVSPLSIHESAGVQAEIADHILDALNEKKTLLCEAGIGNGKYGAVIQSAFAYVQKNEGKLLISMSTPALQEHIMQKVLPALSQEERDIVTEIKEPQRYLSPNRLSAYMNRTDLSTDEAAFIAKVYLWSQKTEMGERDEITLTGEDNLRFEHINVNPFQCNLSREKFFQKAREKEKRARIFLCYHQALGRALREAKNTIPTCDALIVCEAHNFEKYIGLSSSQTLSEKHLISLFKLPKELEEKIAFFFGLLGHLYEKYTHVPNETLICEGQMQQTREWTQLKDVLENMMGMIPDVLKEEPAKAKELLHELSAAAQCFAGENDTIGIVWQNHDESAKLKITRRNPMKALWNNDIFRDAKAKIFISSHLRVNKTFTYIRGRLDLGKSKGDNEVGDDAVREIAIPVNSTLMEKAHLILPKDLPDQEDPIFLDYVTRILKTISQRTPGKTIALFGSKRLLHGTYYKLAEELKEDDIHIVSQDFSGGKGKIVQRYLSDPDHAILFGTHTFIEHIDLRKIPCENLVFFRLPFEQPTDTTTLLESKKYTNPFMEYALPETVLRFLGIINQFLKSEGTQKNIIVFDNRLTKKTYGEIVLNSLPEGMEISSSLPEKG